MCWNKKYQIIEVPKEDAEFLVENSPTDFEMIITEEEEIETPAEIVKEEEPFEEEKLLEVESKKETSPRRSPGRPRKKPITKVKPLKE